MTAIALHRTMSIRKWLALALLSLFLVPFCTFAVIGFALFAPQEGPRDPDQDISALLTRDAARWTDPAWQDSLREDVTGTDIVLTIGGQEIFRTGEPLANDDSALVRKVTVDNSDPLQVAWVYSNNEPGPPEELRQWFVPVAVFTALMLTLAAIAWFLRRAIIQPLESTSEAAHKVARGELDIALPSSRVREVASLNAAFQSMSDDLRHSRARRAAMEREREMFITAIAHDLRTPLFSLRGSLQGLQQGIAASPEQRSHYLRIATDKANQLEHLIADLFAFTRIEYMGDSPERQEIDLAPFLGNTIESVRTQAEEKDIALTLDGEASGVTIEGDPHMLTRAIENILGNALRHTPAEGTIRISHEASSGGVTITVTDSGPGFTEADLPHLFEPLYRGESSRNRATGGAGLGLTIAQRIIVAHGGTLSASNAETGGAKLVITLPGTSGDRNSRS